MKRESESRAWRALWRPPGLFCRGDSHGGRPGVLSGRRAGPGASARPPGREPRESRGSRTLSLPLCGPARSLPLRPLSTAALGVPPAPTARWRLRLPERQAPRHPSRRLSVLTPEIWLSASVLFFRWQKKKKKGLKVIFSA